MGRPFKGHVEELTKEPNVPERRSVLRGFKKFYSKRDAEDVPGNFSDELFDGLSKENVKEL